MKFKPSVYALCALTHVTFAMASSPSNLVKNEILANKTIGDSEIKFQVVSQSAFKKSEASKALKTLKVMSKLNSLAQGEAAKSIATDQELAKQDESLLVGIPLSLIGEQNVFGGVITKVSDKTSEELGVLKLTDLAAVNVRTVISRTQDGYPALTLVGCFAQCDEDSEQEALISMPIVGFDEAKNLVMVDMSAIGQELDLVTMMDPKGSYTKLKAVGSDTVAVDYDLKTLLFDIKTKMIPLDADPKDDKAPITEFTVRWYLKLTSGFNPAFVSREPVEGVGFFKTERAKNTKITRFSMTSINGSDRPMIKYFVKNVPEKFQKHVASALDAWNVESSKVLGRPLLAYEFVEKDDPRHEVLVPGDIRYNIIEWDLDNKASYGALGPSYANQMTGEIFSANVLIQGPTIIKMYTQWFGISEQAQSLIAEGKVEEANKLMKDFNQSAQKELAERKEAKFALKLGTKLDMTIHAQRPELEDPLVKGHFEIVPRGVTFEQYMEGYFGEMLAHELGHNLGLRHNFKGNLGAYENGEHGSVSRSIMEYLGRPYRHLNAIGAYDRMAIAYGYKGVAPTHKNWFCTDEDQATDAKNILTASPECSKSDATSDPFSFWEGRLDRVLDLALERNSNTAPVWKVSEVRAQIDEAVVGLSAYAKSAERTAETWTNFFGKNDRPDDKKEVKDYVLVRMKKKLCNPKLQDVIASKENSEAQKLTSDNLAEVLKAVAETTKKLDAYTTEELDCLK